MEGKKAKIVHKLWKYSRQINWRVDATIEDDRENGIPVLGGEEGAKDLISPEQAKELLEFRLHDKWGRFCFTRGKEEVAWGE